MSRSSPEVSSAGFRPVDARVSEQAVHRRSIAGSVGRCPCPTAVGFHQPTHGPVALFTARKNADDNEHFAPRCHGMVVPWYHGSVVARYQRSGSAREWFRGVMVRGITVSWYDDTVVACVATDETYRKVGSLTQRHQRSAHVSIGDEAESGLGS